MASSGDSFRQQLSTDRPGSLLHQAPAGSSLSPVESTQHPEVGDGHPRLAAQPLGYGSKDEPTAVAHPREATVDILHPLASLEWKECRQLPVGMNTATAVSYGDKLYVGGGYTSGINFRDSARLYIYTPTTNTWDAPIDTPVYWFALTTYHSQLVLVGGKKYVDRNVLENFTNKLWTLSEHGQWQETLPPMRTKRSSACAVSYRDHLLVAGGATPDGSSNVVEVFNGSEWLLTNPLLYRDNDFVSAVLDEHLYFMGGEKIGKEVHYASLDSLLASCQPSETSQPSSVWKKLSDAPYEFSKAVVFGSRLIAVGGGSSYFTSIVHAYCGSFHTNSWIHVGDMPFAVTKTCSVVLPTGELMVVGGLNRGIRYIANVLKATIKVTSYDPDSRFTTSALSRLEGVGIPVMTSLNTNIQLLRPVLSTSVPNAYTFNDTTSLLNTWLSSHVSNCLPPTWKSLLLIIRLLNLDDLAQQIETYLSETTDREEKTRRIKAEDTEKQLRLSEEVIHNLKQEVSSLKEESNSAVFMLKQRIAVLTAENEQLKSQQRVKEEQDLTDEEKPLIPQIKTEFKEGAATVTKSQPESIGIWSLHGVEVCRDMTVVVYSSHTQEITWEGFGLKLHIRKGSLPAGMEQCILQIKASLAGQYEFPENSHLVSAIFWLRCETVHEFTKPITVEIQHCAKSENVANLKLNFVRAICSQKQLPYIFKQLPGGNFTSRSSYGVIELNSFSGVGITQEGSEDREYRSRLFYLKQETICHEIHFVVTWNIAAHLTVVEEEYTKKNALPGPDQNVEFESEAISLDIPMVGIAIKGWKITPLIRPVVTKKEVDSFKPGKGTPRCQLKAVFSGRRKKIPALEHQVTLQGAKFPHNVFTISLSVDDERAKRSQTFGDLAAAATGPPPTKRSRSESDESAFHAANPPSFPTDSASLAGPSSAAIHVPKTKADTGLDAKLDLNSDHFKVTKYLQNLDNDHICDLGGALGLSFSKLRRMNNYPKDMVAAWLRREDRVMTTSGEPTWRSLVEALRGVGQEGTARDIEAVETKIRS